MSAKVVYHKEIKADGTTHEWTVTQSDLMRQDGHWEDMTLPDGTQTCNWVGEGEPYAYSTPEKHFAELLDFATAEERHPDTLVHTKDVIRHSDTYFETRYTSGRIEHTILMDAPMP